MTELDPTVFGKFKDALNTVIEQSKDVIPTEHPATVMAKDEDGTVWVRLFGSDTDTPVSSTTSTVDVGDNVEVVISEGRAKILRNRSTPAAGVSFVARAFGQAVEDAEAYSSIQFADAARMNSITKKLAEEADAIATAINQHFFDDDQGIHVTDVTQDEWEASYPDFSDQSTTKPYNNILVNSAGILLRSALKYLVSISRSGIVFYDGAGNAASNQTASFGINGTIIGKTDSNYITTTSNGIDFFSGNRKMLSFVSRLQGATTYISDIFSKNTYSEADIEINTWDNSANVGSSAKIWGDGGSSSAPASASLGSSYGASEYGTPSIGASVYTHVSKTGDCEIGARVKNSSDPDFAFPETSWRMYCGGFQMYDLSIFISDAYNVVLGQTDQSYVLFQVKHSTGNYKTFTEIYKATNMEGDAVVIGAGGATVIGAGESADNIYANVLGASPGTEQMHIGSDNSIYFHAGCQTFANRKTMTFDTAGKLTIPGDVEATSSFKQKHTTNVSKIGSGVPSTGNIGLGGWYQYDANGYNDFYSEIVKTNADNLYRSYVLKRTSNDGETTYYNGFYMHINSAGVPSVTFTTGGSSAWRVGLGFGKVASMKIDRSTPTFPNSSKYPSEYIACSSTKYTAVSASGWNYIKYNTSDNDSTSFVYHAWGVVRIANTACTTAFGSGYINSANIYIRLPVKAAMIQSVTYGSSMGGAWLGMSCLSAGSNTDWCSLNSDLCNLVVRMYSPISRAASSSATEGVYYIPVDVWFTNFAS